MKKKVWILSVCWLLAGVGVAFGQADSSKGYYTSFDSTRIYFETWGAGQPVVLIHGFTGTGSGWKTSALFDSLIKNGYRVILPDLRGNGKSGKPRVADAYAGDAEARDIMGLVSYLKIPQYKLIGYSRGSIIAARLLILDKRIQQTVLGGMGDDFTDPDWPRRILFYHVLAGDTVVPDLQGMINYIESKGMDRTALALSQKEQPSTSKTELAGVKSRVLVLCGDEDNDNGSGRKLSGLIPASRFVPVPGKHNGTQNTGPFAREVLAFLRE